MSPLSRSLASCSIKTTIYIVSYRRTNRKIQEMEKSTLEVCVDASAFKTNIKCIKPLQAHSGTRQISFKYVWHIAEYDEFSIFKYLRFAGNIEPRSSIHAHIIIISMFPIDSRRTNQKPNKREGNSKRVETKFICTKS